MKKLISQLHQERKIISGDWLFNYLKNYYGDSKNVLQILNTIKAFKKGLYFETIRKETLDKYLENENGSQVTQHKLHYYKSDPSNIEGISYDRIRYFQKFIQKSYNPKQSAQLALDNLIKNGRILSGELNYVIYIFRNVIGKKKVQFIN